MPHIFCILRLGSFASFSFIFLAFLVAVLHASGCASRVRFASRFTFGRSRSFTGSAHVCTHWFTWNTSHAGLVHISAHNSRFAGTMFLYVCLSHARVLSRLYTFVCYSGSFVCLRYRAFYIHAWFPVCSFHLFSIRYAVHGSVYRCRIVFVRFITTHAFRSAFCCRCPAHTHIRLRRSHRSPLWLVAVPHLPGFLVLGYAHLRHAFTVTVLASPLRFPLYIAVYAVHTLPFYYFRSHLSRLVLCIAGSGFCWFVCVSTRLRFARHHYSGLPFVTSFSSSSFAGLRINSRLYLVAGFAVTYTPLPVAHVSHWVLLAVLTTGWDAVGLHTLRTHGLHSILMDLVLTARSYALAFWFTHDAFAVQLHATFTLRTARSHVHRTRFYFGLHCAGSVFRSHAFVTV